MAFPDTVKVSVKRKAHFACCLCHKVGVEVHHIVPAAEGGPDTEDNAAPLCPSCHDDYGANPVKRRFIRETRDFWYDICRDRYASDNDRTERLIGLLEGTTSALTGFQAYVNRIVGSEAAPQVPRAIAHAEVLKASVPVDDFDEEDDFQQEPRTEVEILESLERLFDQIWYNRHWNHRINIEEGRESISPEVWKIALEAAARVEAKYKDDPETLGPWDDFEWGMLNGKMSALRWVLGDEWDFLDT